MDRSALPVRIRGEAVLANDGGFIWYPIPKCASRSVAAALTPYGRRLKDQEGPTGRKALKALAAAPYSFAFVRCPYDRVVSLWRNKVDDPLDTPGQAALFERWPGLSAGMDLDRFVGWLAEHFDEDVCDDHWRPQHQFVTAPGGEPCVSFVGRVESLDRDMATVGAKLGLDFTVAPLNVSAPTADETLPSAAVAVINRLYERDFAVLGYATR